MVDNKEIDAALLYPTGGKEAIITAFQILNKEQFFRDNILQSLVIDAANVRMMELQWRKINSQQNDIVRQQQLLKEQDEIYKDQQTAIRRWQTGDRARCNGPADMLPQYSAEEGLSPHQNRIDRWKNSPGHRRLRR